ncbi:MAG: AAA family ATPase, partial [Victivallales bacterium]|nr:AAA family ATPase [Victivallales bacterium]
IDEVIGRVKETEEMMRCLNRKKKSAPLLIGAPGVGKTAVVEGLARRIALGDVPGIMKDIHIYSLNVNGSISGANCRGDFEKRLNDTFAFIEKQPNAILFIDELHSFLNADKGSGSSGGDAIKPEIASGRLRCIATTTEEDYRKFIAPDKPFARRFQAIQISEPSPEDCVHILNGIKGLYEEHHHIHIQEKQLKRIVDLSVKYLPSMMLPDKAIDILDTVGSKYRLHSKDKEIPAEENSTPDATWAEVTNEDIDAVVCSMAKLPSIPSVDGSGNDNDFAEMATLEDKLKSKVFGQDQAVKELVRALKIAKTGLKSDRAGTLGNFFFAGPTGVGKTEICKSLAEAMHMKLVRFDMSEYQSDQMLTRFVGSAPGYVGFEGGGQLTNAVRDNPNCVILLDEIEKAHSAIHNLLLQVMDDGELTDSRGFKTDFHNAIIIMTSNAGCTEASAKSMRLGFGASQSSSFDDSIIHSAMKSAFSPEFRARLTASVVFNELGDKEMGQIVDYKFNEIVKQASTRGYSVKLTDEARKKIVEKALEAKQGARPVDKILNETVRAPLADLIVASGKQREFSLVLKEDQLSME